MKIFVERNSPDQSRDPETLEETVSATTEEQQPLENFPHEYENLLSDSTPECDANGNTYDSSQ